MSGRKAQWPLCVCVRACDVACIVVSKVLRGLCLSISLGRQNTGGKCGQDMWHLWERSGEMCVGFGGLVMQSGRRRLLGKHRLGWEESIKICLQGIGWEAVDWIDLAVVRDNGRAVLNTVINFQGQGASCCVHGNELSGTRGELLCTR